MRNNLPVMIGIVLTISAAPALAQDVCYDDAKTNFVKWRGEKGKVLDDLSAKYQASKDPSKEIINYNGMRMPIAAALIIEGEKYGREADAKLNVEIEGAKKCSNQTAIPRGVYDLAREWLGLTTILPEKASRIDIEELRRGNIAGGKNSIINETGRKIDETFNPFRWKL